MVLSDGILTILLAQELTKVSLHKFILKRPLNLSRNLQTLFKITYYRQKKFGGFVILLAQESTKVSLLNRLVGRIRFKIKVLGSVFTNLNPDLFKIYCVQFFYYYHYYP